MRAQLFLLLVFTLLFAGGCVTSKETQRNTKLIQRYFDAWVNRADTTVADQLIATNLVLHSSTRTLTSLEDYKKSMLGFHKAFPDLHYTIEDQIAEANKVVVRWNLRGTHLGEYQNRPPSGKSINVTGTSTFRIAGGKIQEIWVSMDRLGLMEQLGWLSLPPK